MSNTKNVLFMESLLISILAGAYKSSVVFAICLALILSITILKTKLWVILLTTVFTIIWGLVGFIVGYSFHNLSIELILATIGLSFAAGTHMLFLNTNDFIALEKNKGKSRDC